MDNPFNYDMETAWCPGCGNFGIKNIMLKALKELKEESVISKEKLVMVSGIGQAAKAPQYLDVNYFNGLHGRALPAATAIKAANPGLKVIVESGDGDMYGEGGNHFLHAMRRNPDITVVVHNNMVYGLTKGQASPTSQHGMVTPIQVKGVFEEPINPIALAISMGVPFVARAAVHEMEQAKEIIKKAVLHKGMALVDVFQACVSFNKINTHKWYRENTYKLDENYNPSDKNAAFDKAGEKAPYPLGIIYENRERPCFEDNLRMYKKNKEPMFKRKVNTEILGNLAESLK